MNVKTGIAALCRKLPRDKLIQLKRGGKSDMDIYNSLAITCHEFYELKRAYGLVGVGPHGKLVQKVKEDA